MTRRPRGSKPKVQQKDIPDSLTVGGHKIQIIVDPNMSYDLHGTYFDKKIHINPFHDEIEGTLFHELVHAAMDISGQKDHLSDDQEEAIVKAIENMIAHLIQIKGVQL